MEGQLKDVWNLDRGTPMHTDLKLKSCQRSEPLQSKCEAGQGIRLWDLENLGNACSNGAHQVKQIHHVFCYQTKWLWQFCTPKHCLARAAASSPVLRGTTWFLPVPWPGRGSRVEAGLLAFWHRWVYLMPGKVSRSEPWHQVWRGIKLQEWDEWGHSIGAWVVGGYQVLLTSPISFLTWNCLAILCPLFPSTWSQHSELRDPLQRWYVTEVDGSNGASCTGAHQSDCKWRLGHTLWKCVSLWSELF